MLKIVERIDFRIYTLEDGDICVDGYELEDGSQAVYIKDHWERNKGNIEPVLEAGEIIGFNLV